MFSVCSRGVKRIRRIEVLFSTASTGSSARLAMGLRSFARRAKANHKRQELKQYPALNA
jgi:hypothetical protein